MTNENKVPFLCDQEENLHSDCPRLGASDMCSCCPCGCRMAIDSEHYPCFHGQECGEKDCPNQEEMIAMTKEAIAKGFYYKYVWKFGFGEEATPPNWVTATPIKILGYCIGWKVKVVKRGYEKYFFAYEDKNSNQEEMVKEDWEVIFDEMLEEYLGYFHAVSLGMYDEKEAEIINKENDEKLLVFIRNLLTKARTDERKKCATRSEVARLREASRFEGIESERKRIADWARENATHDVLVEGRAWVYLSDLLKKIYE